MAMNLPMADLAWRYAIQVLVTVLALIGCRPWRYYPAVSLRAQPLAFLVGVAVFLIWVLPESPWQGPCHGVQDLYLKMMGRPRGTSVAEGLSPYAPEQCGWWLASVRLTGSAFVIAMAEEFFWRGFLLRWLKARPFVDVEPGRIGWVVLLLVSLVFGLEHSSRWLVGMLAGLAYGLLYIRSRDLGAAITAHITTNFLLGLYVLCSRAYHFW